MRPIVLLASAAAILCAAAPAPSSPGGNAAATDAQTYDPNERICESVKVTGSRLAVRKVCATRSERAERRLQDRQAVGDLQTRLCVNTGSNSSGRPSCNH